MEAKTILAGVIILVIAILATLSYTASCDSDGCSSYWVMKGCRSAWRNDDLGDIELLSCIDSCQGDMLCSGMVWASQMVGIMTVTYKPECEIHMGTYDGNYDCMIDDFEMMNTIDSWNAGTMDDFCMLYALDIYTLSVQIPECSVSSSGSCTDTDGGRDYFTKGETSGQTSGIIPSTPGDWAATTDRCVGDDLYEFWCDSPTSANADTYDCPNGCLDGACLPIVTTTTSTTTIEPDTTTTAEPDTTTTTIEPLCDDPPCGGIIEDIAKAINNIVSWFSGLLGGVLG